MDIHLASTPRHLKLTPTMVDDFTLDPVLGAYVLLGVKLDVFQAVRLRAYWWVPNVIDSSGFGTGKSFVFWVFCQLRAMILGDQHICAYFQTFQAVKDIYWPYYSYFNSQRAPLFNAQLGRSTAEGDYDGKDNSRGAACYKQYFKNESVVFGPAPGWVQEAKTQAGLTFNVVGIDEWTKVETMTKKGGHTTNESGATVGGINQQILGRVRRRSWNQYHPLWGNHRVFLATAESTSHEAYARYKTFEEEIRKGNPEYALFTATFKDFSNVRTERDIRVEEGRLRRTRGKAFREEVPNYATISTMKKQFTRAHYLREVLGLWARETLGWYTAEALQACVAAGEVLLLDPECGRTSEAGGRDTHYFMGIDPAPAKGARNDDGAQAVLRVRARPDLGRPAANVPGDWECDYVWAYRVRGETRRNLGPGVFRAQNTRAWSGLIHKKHQDFGLTGILMDLGGGGAWIQGDLNKTIQFIDGVDTQVTPIACTDDNTVGQAHFILNLLVRRDAGIKELWPILAGDDKLAEAMHVVFQEAVEHARLRFPKPFNERPRETTRAWSPEQQWALKNLDAARQQLQDIQVETRDDGTWSLTRNGAKKFISGRKKDLAYALILAWVRFLIWLKLGEGEWGLANEDEVGFYSAR